MVQLHMTAHGHFHVAQFYTWRSFIEQNGAIYYIRRLGCCALAWGEVDLDCFGASAFGPEKGELAFGLVAGLEAALVPDMGKH